MLKIFRHIVIALIALSPLTGATQDLQISGSTTVQKRIVEPYAANIQAATGIELKIFPVGSGRGVLDLINKKVTVAAVSETLSEAIASAKKTAAAEGKEISVPSNLQFHEITIDKIVVVIHPDNRVSKLTIEQAKDIFTGKIKNWQEVGGADQEIVVLTGPPSSATRAVFQKKVMGDAEYAAGTKAMRATTDEIKGISLNKGAISALSAGVAAQAADKVKIVDGVEVLRPLAFITVGAASVDAQKVIDYLKSKAGQKLLAQ